MGFVDAIRSGFRQYAVFSGRASRPEFWWFYLLYSLVTVGAVLLLTTVTQVETTPGDLPPSSASPIGPILVIVVVAVFVVPMLALSVRRLHDTDKSGWFLLLGLVPFGGIVLLVFWCLAGDPGPNRFGPPPGGVDGVPIPPPPA